MPVFDGKRLTNIPYTFDIAGIRQGFYSDRYFDNVRQILKANVYSQKTFADYSGKSPRDLPDIIAQMVPGELEVEAQIFNRRQPKALIAGVDTSLWLLRHITGYTDKDGHFVNTWDQLEVEAVHDGVFTTYTGDAMQIQPVIKIRGKYKDFSILETILLGVLSRASRIATNVYSLLGAVNGKQLLFFPARFDMPEVQAIDGYAYWIAVKRHNMDFDMNIPPMASTDAQGAWWGSKGMGTVPHAIIANFFADTAAVMVAFAETMPLNVPRIALVDFNNDCVGATLATMRVYWTRYLAALQSNNDDDLARWTLSGVRVDTGASLTDKSLQPDGPTGVNETLIYTLRDAIDAAWKKWDVPANYESTAQEFCQRVNIAVSGGFNHEKIQRFEENGVPVSAYGVGSSLLSNESSLGTNTDFTMDVVRIKLDGKWYDIPKIGRQPCDNPDLQPVDLSQFG